MWSGDVPPGLDAVSKRRWAVKQTRGGVTESKTLMIRESLTVAQDLADRLVGMMSRLRIKYEL